MEVAIYWPFAARLHVTIQQDLIPLLQCPRTGSPLVLEEDDLVAIDDSEGQRYRVVQGIPMLLSGAPGRAEIVDAFHSRSTTYYRDNYATTNNSARQVRQRLVIDLLRRSARSGSRILEAGAGPAALGAEILELTSRYVAVDVSLENLLAGRERLGRLDGVAGDLVALPFRSESFDVVLAIGCLEYVPELPAAIGELIRVTAPGGTIIATFANAASPPRRWEEHVAYPMLAAAKRLKGNAAPRYPRWLQQRSTIEKQFVMRGATVMSVCFYGEAIAGYPLTRSDRIRSADHAAATLFRRLLPRRAEFLVHSQRPG